MISLQLRDQDQQRKASLLGARILTEIGIEIETEAGRDGETEIATTTAGTKIRNRARSLLKIQEQRPLVVIAIMKTYDLQVLVVKVTSPISVR